MKTFDTRTYSVSDLEEWNASDLLDLSPEFQRRSVWKQSAKSYLIDTIVRGRPIPKVIFTQHLEERRNVRTVVDGQQRLRAILEYLEDAFPLSRAHNKEFASQRFSDLPEEVQRSFRKYEIGVDLLFDVSYEDMLDIFTRLNAYTVPLSREEKLNAQYVGYFKQSAFQTGHRYAEYWHQNKVLTASTISRMGEAALAADLLIVTLDGPQSNKAVESYYKKWEDEEGNVGQAEARLDMVMELIAKIYPGKEMAGSAWSRTVQFYTLFGALAALKGLVPGMEHLANDGLVKRAKELRVKLDDFSRVYDDFDPEDENNDNDLERYMELSRRRTADKSSRADRITFLVQQLGFEG